MVKKSGITVVHISFEVTVQVVMGGGGGEFPRYYKPVLV